MAGYVLHKLKKKKKIVDYLVQKDREYIDQTSSPQWVQLVDCGGLVHVTKVSMEIVIVTTCMLKS